MAFSSLVSIPSKETVGVSVSRITDEEICLNAVKVRKYKDELLIADSASFSSVEDLKKFAENCPCIIIIEGKGVIQKLIVNTMQTEDWYFAKIFPNTNISDFYVNVVEQGEQALVTIARHDFISNAINLLKNANLFVHSVYVGASLLTLVPALSGNVQGTYSILHQSVQFENGLIHSLAPSDNHGNYEFSNEKVEYKHLTSFIAGLQFFLNESKIPVYLDSSVDFQYWKLFAYTFWTVLIVGFTLLLANYFLFDSWYRQNLELSQELNRNSNVIEQIDNLQSQVVRKEKFLNQNGLDKPLYYSFYADRIAFTVPSSILLLKMDINPVDIKTSGREIKIQRNLIKLEGAIKNSNLLYEWVNILKIEKWVKTIEIEKIKKDPGVPVTNFSIRISY